MKKRNVTQAVDALPRSKSTKHDTVFAGSLKFLTPRTSTVTQSVALTLKMRTAAILFARAKASLYKNVLGVQELS
jgi:hypothetical protein